ncbi:MAG: TlpA family protein disulfide reductase [Luteibaculaceae bacterium]
MRNSSWIFALVFAFAMAACAVEEPKEASNFVGQYRLVFETPTHHLPVQFEIVERKKGVLEAFFDNGRDTFFLETPSFLGKDTLLLKTPIYNTSFQLYFNVTLDTLLGVWINEEALRFDVPVFALKNKPVFNAQSESAVLPFNRFKAEFLNIYKRTYPAIGVFEQDPKTLAVFGTFATQFGDYRALKGGLFNDTLKLSAFDGVRISYFFAPLKGDSLVQGILVNQKGISATWYGVANDTFLLQSPDAITTFTPTKTFQAKAMNLDGQWEPLSVNNHKLTIVQISGTWCPNCKDETKFLNQLMEKYQENGLAVKSIFFERGTNPDTTAILSRLTQYKETLGANFPYFYAGEPKKEVVENTFLGLENFYSYPSTLFVKQNGEVAVVYSGFYGPQTGELHHLHLQKIESEVRTLLGI